MSQEEADKVGGIAAREYFRATNGKANLAPKPESSAWFGLRSVPLGNGTGDAIDYSDHVQVAEVWEWPDMMASVTVGHLR